MYVSRAGEKLEKAIEHWKINVKGLVCADLGSNVGGFVDCLLQKNAKKVYSIDTAYGVLDYKLRNDERVIVMERTNALHVSLPEKVNLLTIDLGWTKQENILKKAFELVKKDGMILSLLKPQYEAGDKAVFKEGKKVIANSEEILKNTLEKLKKINIVCNDVYECPVRGGKGNIEYWLRFRNEI